MFRDPTTISAINIRFRFSQRLLYSSITKVAGKEAENNTLADCYIGEGAPYSVLVDTDEEGNCRRI